MGEMYSTRYRSVVRAKHFFLISGVTIERHSHGSSPWVRGMGDEFFALRYFGFKLGNDAGWISSVYYAHKNCIRFLLDVVYIRSIYAVVRPFCDVISALNLLLYALSCTVSLGPSMRACLPVVLPSSSGR